MGDTVEVEEFPLQTNGISDGLDDNDRAKIRPADIDADVREMERRKRVEAIMNSKLFREELERIIETQLKDGSGTSGLLQQISDMVGVNKQTGNAFKNPNCVIPINDIRGIEAMAYGKGEKILRCKLASVFRLIDLHGWNHSTNTLITARLNQEEEQFLVSPYGMLFHEITASSLIKVDMQGSVIEQGTTNFIVNISAFSLHAAVHSARPDLKCIIHVQTPSVVAVSALKHGLLPLSQESVVIGEVSTHSYLGGLLDSDEKDKLSRNFGPINKVLLLSNQGALCCGGTIEEAFFNARNIVLASESQLKLLPIGIDNLVLLSDESRKKIYNAAHKPPEGTPRPDQPSILETRLERKWRVGGIEYEALMRMLDNAGFRTGYIYRHPLVKGEPPRPRNDIEVPPAVSSLGYLLEEEELYRQGLWRKLEGGRKGQDRSRWLNSPNVYQKVEILETGTPDPKKITKWVTDDSPNHSNAPVKIESALQFVPQGTNPKEFKQKQQQIKDYRRADKISAGPQSHILEGVTWEEARKMQDATVTQTGDQVVLMGAASKGIIQRGHQHNATVYKSPYAKNPFDSVTDEELDEYKKVVEKKSKGEYDTDFSESEGFSSAHINKKEDDSHLRSPTSITSDAEEESRDGPQILRIETKTAPRPSQPEVVLSDGTVPFSHFNTRASKNHYRTNSHYGFPKGSYLIPNPTHYHIAQQTQAAKVLYPAVIKVSPSKISNDSAFRPNLHNCETKPNLVTLKFSNIHSVSMNISLDSLREFVIPFAAALNYASTPTLNNQSSQTSYLSKSPDISPHHMEYTELKVDHLNTLHSTIHSIPDNSMSFERQILNNLRQNLIADIVAYESLSSTETNESSESTDFKNNNEDSSQERTAEAQPFTIDNFTCSSCQSSVQHFEESEVTKIIDDNEQSKPVDIQFSSQMTDNTVANALPAINMQLLDPEIGDNTGNAASRSRGNNGTSECMAMSMDVNEPDICCNWHNGLLLSDKTVIEIAENIYDYLTKQGFELKELIIFPELVYDQNLSELLSKLKHIYLKSFGNNLSDEEKSTLRLSIAFHVLKDLDIDFTKNICKSSEKLLTITEYLSDILDKFFEGLITTDKGVSESKLLDQAFSKGIEEDQQNVSEDKADQEQITAFKRDETSGSESYWFAMSTATPKRPSRSKKAIVNIDEIPLNLPQDCRDINVQPVGRELSPILEESRVNLFQSFDADIDSYPYKSFFDEYEIIDNEFAEEHTEPIERLGTTLIDNSDKHDVTDREFAEQLTDIYGTDSYKSFEQPEINVVVCRQVNFFRTRTVNSRAYVKSDNVVFTSKPAQPTEEKKSFGQSDFQDEDENKENNRCDLNESGNWMGYENARF